MTVKEFTQYLVSIGGLVDGRDPDRKLIFKNICQGDDGCLGLIDDLID